MDYRQRLNELKKQLENTKGAQNLPDKISNCINETAEAIADDTRLDETLIKMALEEMMDIVDEYSNEEIEIQLAENE